MEDLIFARDGKNLIDHLVDPVVAVLRVLDPIRCYTRAEYEPHALVPGAKH